MKVIKCLTVSLLIMGSLSATLAAEPSPEELREEYSFISHRFSLLNLDSITDRSTIGVIIANEFVKIKAERPNMVFFQRITLQEFLQQIVNDIEKSYSAASQNALTKTRH